MFSRKQDVSEPKSSVVSFRRVLTGLQACCPKWPQAPQQLFLAKSGMLHVSLPLSAIHMSNTQFADQQIVHKGCSWVTWWLTTSHNQVSSFCSLHYWHAQITNCTLCIFISTHEAYLPIRYCSGSSISNSNHCAGIRGKIYIKVNWQNPERQLNINVSQVCNLENIWKFAHLFEIGIKHRTNNLLHLRLLQRIKFLPEYMLFPLSWCWIAWLQKVRLWTCLS